MSFVNYHTKEINCKVVYYGPGMSGKTTNLQYIYQKTSMANKGELVTLNTENERTLFFDFLPLDLGEVSGFKTRFHLYTVPGQSFYEASRKLILRGVDGIVFVADSQVDCMEENRESLQDLKNNLEEQGIEYSKIPIVFQWNKRDLSNTIATEELKKELAADQKHAFDTIALEGDGVFDTLKTISNLVLMNIKGSLN